MIDADSPQRLTHPNPSTRFHPHLRQIGKTHSGSRSRSDGDRLHPGHPPCESDLPRHRSPHHRTQRRSQIHPEVTSRLHRVKWLHEPAGDRPVKRHRTSPSRGRRGERRKHRSQQQGNRVADPTVHHNNLVGPTGRFQAPSRVVWWPGRGIFRGSPRFSTLLSYETPASKSLERNIWSR